MGLNVLIVDDSAVMREIVAKTLRASGLPLDRLHEAGNGREALAILERDWVDVALIDIHMPVMNGEELIDHLRASDETRDLPVIVVSSESSEKRIHVLQSKGTDFIHKPFTAEALRDAVLSLTGLPDDLLLAKQMRDLAADSLEKMCFLVPAEEERDPVPGGGAMMVRYEGPHSGALVLSADAELYGSLAAAMLGSPETTEAQRADALGEMANVICGSLVQALGGVRGDFRLAAPEPYLEEPGQGLRAVEARLSFEEGSLDLRLLRSTPAGGRA
jgi:two-component system chemotaxis response regulator CheY